MQVRIKRVYEAPAAEDGKRILVDRLWPRGLTKEEAHIDWWFKDIAPTPELREWFSHDPAKWEEFSARYETELQANTVAVNELRKALAAGPATLVYGAKDEQHTHALVLKNYLEMQP